MIDSNILENKLMKTGGSYLYISSYKFLRKSYHTIFDRLSAVDLYHHNGIRALMKGLVRGQIKF